MYYFEKSVLSPEIKFNFCFRTLLSENSDTNQHCAVTGQMYDCTVYYFESLYCVLFRQPVLSAGKGQLLFPNFTVQKFSQLRDITVHSSGSLKLNNNCIHSIRLDTKFDIRKYARYRKGSASSP